MSCGVFLLPIFFARTPRVFCPSLVAFLSNAAVLVGNGLTDRSIWHPPLGTRSFANTSSLLLGLPVDSPSPAFVAELLFPDFLGVMMATVMQALHCRLCHRWSLPSNTHERFQPTVSG